MHVKVGRLTSASEEKGKGKKREAEGEFGRIDCSVMVARGSADAIRISACAR